MKRPFPPRLDQRPGWNLALACARARYALPRAAYALAGAECMPDCFVPTLGLTPFFVAVRAALMVEQRRCPATGSQRTLARRICRRDDVRSAQRACRAGVGTMRQWRASRSTNHAMRQALGMNQQQFLRTIRRLVERGAR